MDRVIALMFTALLGTTLSVFRTADAAGAPSASVAVESNTPPSDRFGTPILPVITPSDPYRGIIWKHGDISWLPSLAALAGWDDEQIPRLGKYILRESGGCPNRRGGDKVDKWCNITGVSEWNHRSDTGLLQINGLNYDLSRNKWALLCNKLSICSQEPLFDPLTNLRAARVLYEHSGWKPWEPCMWGDEYAHLCKKVGKVTD